MLVCSSPRCLRIVLQGLLTFEASRHQQLDLLTAELGPSCIRHRFHKSVEHACLTHPLARAIEVIAARHRASVKENTKPRIVGLAQALNVNTAALTFRHMLPMS